MLGTIITGVVLGNAITEGAKTFAKKKIVGEYEITCNGQKNRVKAIDADHAKQEFRTTYGGNGKIEDVKKISNPFNINISIEKKTTEEPKREEKKNK